MSAKGDYAPSIAQPRYDTQLHFSTMKIIEASFCQLFGQYLTEFNNHMYSRICFQSYSMLDKNVEFFGTTVITVSLTGVFNPTFESLV
jgi:hypothetical protein